MDVEVSGFVGPGFEQVRETMIDNLTKGGEVGGAVCVYMGGEPVVDLWGGRATASAPWQNDTVVPIYSVVKGATALVIQILADRGMLDLDEKIAHYWPEFACNGKDDATVKMIMCHTVGLPWFDEYWDVVSFDSESEWANVDGITARLAAQKPLWEPGTQYGYHSISFGWLAGEIVKRVTGQTIGTYFREVVGEPFGIDLSIGLPDSEHGRVAELQPPPDHDPTKKFWADSTSEARGTMFIGPEGRPPWEVGNCPEYWRAEGPAAGGVANARAIARMYAILANGGTLDGAFLVSPESIAVHGGEQISAPDCVYGNRGRIGYGFQLARAGIYFGPNDKSFGFTGFGGSVGFADPEAGLSFSYTMNQMRMVSHAADPPVLALMQAVYDAVGD